MLSAYLTEKKEATLYCLLWGGGGGDVGSFPLLEARKEGVKRKSTNN